MSESFVRVTSFDQGIGNTGININTLESHVGTSQFCLYIQRTNGSPCLNFMKHVMKTPGNSKKTTELGVT